MAFCAPAAIAGPLDDLVKIEVLDGGATQSGTYRAALRLTLADGWKTYWRSPGDAGIPPSFSWRGSRNLGNIAITWPTPQVFSTSGMQTIGYVDQLTLPIEITPDTTGRPIRLKGRMELGICKDVCVPSELKFDHTLDLDADRNPSILAALAARPYSSAEAGVTAATCRLKPTRNGMQVEARISMPSTGGTEVAVIEPGSPDIWASHTASERHGNTLVATTELIHSSGEPYALDRSQIRITVLGRNHAVDIQGCTPG
ncbi:protein-disulfide reductase DsbD family protein [Aliisedimentitalea scapharcae]|uniref:Protein-disulfide reductase DsbD family protein n=2 Tax=Aliisedimentitalea scapharcae TaxID=1524259 RepID=A0ABZ2XXY1_9RHOB